MTRMSLTWLLLTLVVLGVEFFAIFRKDWAGTLSHQVWVIAAYQLGRAIVLSAWFWLSWHWFIEPAVRGGEIRGWKDDVIAAAFGLVVGLLIRGKKRSGGG